jgi:pimeloyl-ACP methyl ester carboxylesterase
MTAFAITLLDGRKLTGKPHFPETASKIAIAVTLIVAVHGGTYSSNSFDADDNHPVRHIVQASGIPVIAIDRPGYAGSSPPRRHPSRINLHTREWKISPQSCPPLLVGTTFRSPWCIIYFLMGHSIRAAIALVAASRFESDKTPAAYKLSGISISGVGSRPKELPLREFDDDMRHQKGLTVRFPNEMKDAVMGGPSGLCDPKILLQTERLQHEATVEELYDINYL